MIRVTNWLLNRHGYPKDQLKTLRVEWHTRGDVMPPRWAEQPNCMVGRCGCTFGLTARRHHCRNCGNSVCSDHCIHSMAVPRLGFQKPVLLPFHPSLFASFPPSLLPSFPPCLFPSLRLSGPCFSAHTHAHLSSYPSPDPPSNPSLSLSLPPSLSPSLSLSLPPVLGSGL